MQQDNKDNFEKFFRDKFNQNLNQEEWNNPDDYVWENIEKDLKKNKRRLLPVWFPWGLSGLLLACILLLLNIYLIKDKEIAKLQSKLEEVNQSINKTQPGISSNENQTNNSLLNSENNHNPSTQVQQKMNKKGERSYSESSDPKASFQKSKSINSKQPDKTTDQNPISNYEITIMEQNLITGSNENMLNEVNLNASVISDLKTINFNFIKSRMNIPLHLPAIKKSDPKKTSDERSWYVGPGVGVNFWFGKGQGQIKNPLSELILNEHTEVSPNLGIRFRKKISSRWAIEGGINFLKRNHETNYQLDIPYNLQTELVTPSGETENIFIHSLPTELGDIETHLIMERLEGSMVQHNESVVVDFSVTNQMQLFHIPIYTNYYFSKKGEGFFLTAGLISEWIVNTQFEVNENVSHHSNIREKHAIVSFNSDSINKFNLYGSAGIGYDYKWGKDFTISSSAIFGKSLTKLYQKNEYKYSYDFMNIQFSMLKVF
ncbi:MAG: outer membrane beta-barrel protein [Saprospiraceae bacterium]|nr:outer membrane beta-barrel protein [Saprospiraceae bacterium]